MIGYSANPGRFLRVEHSRGGEIVSIGGSRTIPSAASFNERMVRRCFLQMMGQESFGLRMHWWWRMRHYAVRERKGSQ